MMLMAYLSYMLAEVSTLHYKHHTDTTLLVVITSYIMGQRGYMIQYYQLALIDIDWLLCVAAA
jgi:hypothetical protein